MGSGATSDGENWGLAAALIVMGSGILLITRYGFKSGNSALGPGIYADRRENPRAFWVILILNGLLGAGIAVGGLVMLFNGLFLRH